MGRIIPSADAKGGGNDPGHRRQRVRRLAVARQLAQAGEQVRVLVRSTSSRVNLADPRLEIVQGDLRDARSLDRAMQGVRFLFHVAADYRLWARDPGEILRANVEGTRACDEAAMRPASSGSSTRRSVATLSARRRPPSDETAPLAERMAVGAYKHSKVAAERLVEQMVAERLARGDRQSVDPDRTARRPADADRPDRARSRVGPHARLCRHRPQPCPCRGRRRRPSRWPGGGAASANAICSAARTYG